jgi:hypothetical protein
VKNHRVIVWFSCGAASTTAGYLAIKKYGRARVSLVYCNTLASEHPDNARYLRDVEKWLRKKVTIISSDLYASIDEVFEKTRYMAGISGARCTGEMKKKPRFAFQRPDDIHIFGMTCEEEKRIENLQRSNPELKFDWILRDTSTTKAMCMSLIVKFHIRLPILYSLGFKNNNCIGCVKATSIEYWKKVRRYFPEVFARRAAQCRDLNVRLTRLHGERIFIDEIPIDDDDAPVEENISCGPECGFASLSTDLQHDALNSDEVRNG